MKYKHTSGEWEVVESNLSDHTGIIVVSKHNDLSWNIADMVGGLQKGEVEANAKLISKAPSLLKNAEESHQGFMGLELLLKQIKRGEDVDIDSAIEMCNQHAKNCREVFGAASTPVL